MMNLNCNQIKIFINLEIIVEEDKNKKKLYIYILYGPILPCVQTVLEGARPNTSLILTNGVRKGPAQYPV